MKASRNAPRRPRRRLLYSAMLGLFGLTLPAPIGAADEVTLSTGETLRGTVVEQTDAQVVLDHAVLGQVTIPRDQITELAVEAPPDASTTEAAETPPAEALKEKIWKSKIDLALAGSWGNSDTQSFLVGFDTRRESDESRTRIDASYIWSASNGDRDKNRFSTGIRHDWLIPDSRWFWFATGRFDYDEFKSWEYRLTGHTGPGYELIKTDDFKVNLRGGLGVSQRFHALNEDLQFEALAGFDLIWKISENQNFELHSTIFPDLTNGGEFRTFTELAWSVVLDEEMGLNFSSGLRHEYESEIDPGFKHYDLNVFAGLQYEF